MQIEADIKAMTEKGNETHELVKDLHKRLLVGNGTPAMTTRLDRLERDHVAAGEINDAIGLIKAVRVALVAITLSALIGGLAVLFWHLFTPNVHGAIQPR